MKNVLVVLAFVSLFAGGWYGYYLHKTSGRPYGHYELGGEILHFGINKFTWRSFTAEDQPPLDANGSFSVDEDGNYVARFQRLIDAPRWAISSEKKSGRWYEEVLYTLSYDENNDSLKLLKITVNIKRNLKIKDSKQVRVTGSKIFEKQVEK